MHVCFCGTVTNWSWASSQISFFRLSSITFWVVTWSRNSCRYRCVGFLFLFIFCIISICHLQYTNYLKFKPHTIHWSASAFLSCMRQARRQLYHLFPLIHHSSLTFCWEHVTAFCPWCIMGTFATRCSQVSETMAASNNGNLPNNFDDAEDKPMLLIKKPGDGPGISALINRQIQGIIMNPLVL